ncbi:MAG: SDR family NAD(P)-dependent oxidoreductase, partial [Planctomycetota bacterium]
AATNVDQLPCSKPPAVDIEKLRAQFTDEPRDVAWQAQVLKQAGLDPKPSYLWLEQHWYHNGAVLGAVRPPRENDHVGDYQIHPGLLDSAFQALGAARPFVERALDTFLPVSIERLTVWHSLREVAWIVGKLDLLTIDRALGDVQFLDASGRVLAELERVQLRRVPRDWIQRLKTSEQPDWVHELAWQPAESVTGSVDPTRHPEAPRSWLIFDCQAGIGAEVAKRLELKGCVCQLSRAESPEERRRIVRDFAQAAKNSPTNAWPAAAAAPGILYLSGTDAGDFAASRQAGWGGLLDVLHGALDAGSSSSPRLWVVTRGAQAAGPATLPVAVTQSLLWGLGRVIASEHPELSSVRIDLDPRGQQSEVDQLTEELWWGGREDQVALRGEDRFVARLRPRTQQNQPKLLTTPASAAYQLEILRRGQLDQIELVACEPTPPAAGEVTIRVQSTGLNFRDVLNVLDLYPGDPGALGGECVGEVVAAGADVHDLRIGDRVLALAPNSFASYVTIPIEFCQRCPRELSSAEAATIPIAFLTCWHALRDIAQLQRGERVLIHAGTGGVGLAAVQIARFCGATIFATAGSERKRDYLRRLGIEHVYDSRSTSFAAEIMAVTAGEGIDVVLNSLTGDSIEASLSTLRPGGRFLELGKTDLWDQARVDQVRPGVTFHAIALDELMAQSPAVIAQLFQTVMRYFSRGELQPLPSQTYPIQKMVSALRIMARAEHIGKLVIEAATNALPPQLWFQDDATYLITGGLGGLGLRLAHWLAEHGARHLVLTGRSAASAEAREQINALELAGVHVVEQRCDLGERTQVEQLLQTIARELPPLRGVFHLAGVLDDGILREQNRSRFDRVLAAKALGGWYLHELTSSLPLDYFVLFSSAASLLGSPGQGNYAAANAMLDGLAHARRALGLPGTSINWGSWSDVGMAARLKESQGSRWAEAGIGWIEPDLGLRTLENLLLDDVTQAGVLPMDWPKFFARIPAGAEPIWMSELAATARAAKPKTDAATATLAVQLAELTPSERLEHASSFLGRQAAQVLAMDESSLPDPRRPLTELGFDSLTGVEFCNRVSRAIGHALNPTLLFEYPTLESLALHIIRDLLHLDFSSTAAAPESAANAESSGDDSAATAVSAEETLEQVEGMTDEQMDALVLEQLQKLGALPAFDDGNAAESPV